MHTPCVKYSPITLHCASGTHGQQFRGSINYNTISIILFHDSTAQVELIRAPPLGKGGVAANGVGKKKAAAAAGAAAGAAGTATWVAHGGESSEDEGSEDSGG